VLCRVVHRWRPDRRHHTQNWYRAQFFSQLRQPVRFYTVEALLVMQKVGGRHDPHLNPFELKNFSLCFPRFAPPAPKNSFRPIISVSSRPPTLSHTRSPCCTNLPATLFPPQAPPKSLSWFGTHGLRPCKTATTMSDTIRQPVCTMPFHAPSSHHGTNCPAFSCHTSCIQ